MQLQEKVLRKIAICLNKNKLTKLGCKRHYKESSE